MYDFGGGNFGAFGNEFQLFIIERRPAIFDVKFGDNHVETFPLEVAVSKAVGAEKFGSAHFEVNWVHAVVDDACLVGLAVPRHNGYRVGLNGCFFRENHEVRLAIFFKLSRTDTKNTSQVR